MIPCYSLFLEVEIPDPSLNYFVIGRDDIQGPMLLAPNLIVPPDSNAIFPHKIEIQVESTEGWTELPIPYYWTYTWNVKVVSAGNKRTFVDIYENGELYLEDVAVDPFESVRFSLTNIEADTTPKVVEVIAYNTDKNNSDRTEVGRETKTLYTEALPPGVVPPVYDFEIETEVGEWFWVVSSSGNGRWDIFYTTYLTNTGNQPAYVWVIDADGRVKYQNWRLEIGERLPFGKQYSASHNPGNEPSTYWKIRIYDRPTTWTEYEELVNVVEFVYLPPIPDGFWDFTFTDTTPNDNEWFFTNEGWTYECVLEAAHYSTYEGAYYTILDEAGNGVDEVFITRGEKSTTRIRLTNGNDAPQTFTLVAHDKAEGESNRVEVWRTALQHTPPTAPTEAPRYAIQIENKTSGAGWVWTDLPDGSYGWLYQFKLRMTNVGSKDAWCSVIWDRRWLTNWDDLDGRLLAVGESDDLYVNAYEERKHELGVSVRQYSGGDTIYRYEEIFTPPPIPNTERDTKEECEVSGKNTLILDQSCIESDIDLLEGYGAAKPGMAWVDLITDSTEIKIERGFDTRQGVVGTPIAGVMSATIMDPYLDALATQRVAIGQRCRLRAGGTIVFTGVVNTLRSDYNAVDTPTLYLESVDALGLLNAQMVDARPQENYKTRLQTAVNKIGLVAEIQDTTTILNPTEDAMSALDLLIETQDSEGSVCWLDRYGVFYSTNRYWKDEVEAPVFRNSRFYGQTDFLFTNNPKGDDLINIGGSFDEVCMSAYQQSADTREVINGITFYNYVENAGEIERETYTYESGNSRRLYGDAGVKLTTYLNPSTLPAYADYIFTNYDTPYTKVERIQFPLDKWKSLEVPSTTQLDIGDKVAVEIDDPYSGQKLAYNNQRISKIIHNITPVEWLCELELI